MEEWLYVMLIKKTKEYRRLNKAGVTEHIENLRKLDEEGTIELAGAFKGYPGMAGMLQTAMKKPKQSVKKNP